MAKLVYLWADQDLFRTLKSQASCCRTCQRLLCADAGKFVLVWVSVEMLHLGFLLAWLRIFMRSTLIRRGLVLQRFLQSF